MNTIHIELTTNCQLGCPMCGRNLIGDEINPFLLMKELTLSDIQKILPVDTVKKLHRVYLCGNYGEPIVAKDCLSIVKYLRDCNSELNIGMNTNGSARTTSWWRELAKIIGQHGSVRFGIDGLKDTNHLYRQNADFDMIMDNARSFIEVGGHAQWDYLVFEHNENQVEEARQLSVDMGFKSFNVKATTRFRTGSRPVNNKGVTTHYIKPTNIQKYHNPIIEYKPENYKEIECKTLQNHEVYLSAEGLVFPCCWVAGQLYSFYNSDAKKETEQWIDSLGGKDSIDGKLHDIFEIDNKIYQSLKQSWDATPMSTCQHTCGLNVDKFKVQFK